MTPLRLRMIDTMVQRGFALRTQESYVDAVVRKGSTNPRLVCCH